MATDIFVGNVAVGVVPDARGWNQKLRAELVPSASAVGDEIGSNISRGITDKMGEAGTKAGGAFEDTFRKRVKAALDSLPKDATGPIAELRAKLQTLYDSDIIDGDKAVKELIKVDTALKDVSKNAKDIRLSFDTKEARAQLALLRNDIGRSGSGAGGGGGILGGISGVFGGGGAAAAQAPGAAAPAAGGIASVMSNPYAIAGAVTAGLAALPFVAQIAAGGIVAALGGALLGVGVIGAIMTGKLTNQFNTFKASAKSDLENIGQSFVPVLQSILRTAQGVLKYLTPVFKAAAATIAGPFQIFANTVLKAFMQPAVKKSIQDIADAFSSVMKAFTPDIPGIMQSLAEAISRVAKAVAANPKAFADFLNFIFQLIIMVIDAIAWLTRFANYIEQRFIPAIQHLVNVWIGVGHDIEHYWDMTWNNTIGRTERGLHDIAVLFDNSRHQLAASTNQTGRDIVNVWNSIWNNTVGRAIRGGKDVVHAAEYVKHILDVWHSVDSPSRRIWDGMWSFFVSQPINDGKTIVRTVTKMVQDIISLLHFLQNIASTVWNQIWNDTVGQAIRGYQRLLPVFRTIGNMVSSTWHAIASVSSAIWNQIWSNTIGQAIRGVQSLTGVFNTIRGRVVGALSSAGSWLVGIGNSIIQGLLHGISSAMAGVGGWIKGNVVDPIIASVKHWFGITSPATVMMPVGENVIKGIVHGMLTSGANLGPLVSKIFGGWPQALGSLVSKSIVDVTKLPAKALSALGSVASKLGGFFAKLFGGGGSGGVSQWTGMVMQALALNRLPMSLTGQVLHQMQTESGGNVNAINLTDINAQMGDPSRGLMQVIGSTFAAYHVPGTSGNIYDPLANIAAAINYAAHVYGPSLMRGGMGMGSGHGYDSGGWLPPGVTMAVNSTRYPELVLSQEDLRQAALNGGATYHAHFDGLTGAAIESHVRTAFQAMSLTQGNMQRQGRRR
jgi:phage-related protein